MPAMTEAEAIVKALAKEKALEEKMLSDAEYGCWCRVKLTCGPCFSCVAKVWVKERRKQ